MGGKEYWQITGKVGQPKKLHPWGLTWYWKISMFNRKCIFIPWWIFHCHLSFSGGMLRSFEVEIETVSPLGNDFLEPFLQKQWTNKATQTINISQQISTTTQANTQYYTNPQGHRVHESTVYLHTPWKINMEPEKINPVEKGNHLPNLHFWVPC